MAKSLREWVDNDVTPVKEKPLRWLAEEYFFRDPTRPALTDTSYFFSPADGIVVYQQTVMPDEPIVDIKGKSYSLRDAIRDPSYDRESLVIGVFMTFVDVHINRVPFPGRLSYKELDEIGTYNQPTLGVEKGLFQDLRLDTGPRHHDRRCTGSRRCRRAAEPAPEPDAARQAGVPAGRAVFALHPGRRQSLDGGPADRAPRARRAQGDAAMARPLPLRGLRSGGVPVAQPGRPQAPGPGLHGEPRRGARTPA